MFLLIIGSYECTLVGEAMKFLQKGDVKEENIKQAPNIRLQSRINVECKTGTRQALKCCVQSNYRVSWFQGTTNLQSGENELMFQTLQSSHTDKLEAAINSSYY